MIVSLSTCPICKGQLKLQDLVTSVSKYICQVCASGTTQSHYELHTNGAGGIQVFNIYPYIIYNNLATKRTFVHSYDGRKQIMECALIPFESSEKIIERIKGLIVFS